MEYAIVDIETTGGYAAGSGITEIAIVLHDGRSVTGRYETLINPLQPIPVHIRALTGIDNTMVAGSPTFSEIAGQVFNLLEGRIFVAHNVNFDYSFIKHHLAEAGYAFSAPRLCTVRMSRKIRPGLMSYSLGRLCSELDIPICNRHRAGGDADATAILFARLMEWDTEGNIAAMLKKGSKEQQLPPNLSRQDILQLPVCPGVYYFRNKDGKVIYVGKAKNLRKRVNTHFAGHNPNPQRQHFLRSIYTVRYVVCGTELMAFLLEAAEIQRLWPLYNRSLKKYHPKFGLFVYEGLDNYLHLAIGKYNKSHLPVQVFTQQDEATSMLRRLVQDFELCPKLCRLRDCTNECIHRESGKKCPAGQVPELYNRQVQNALSRLKEDLPTFLLIDEGRSKGELSCILVENGCLYGMGYISDHEPLQIESVKKLLTLYTGNHYMVRLIRAFADKYPDKVVSAEEGIRHS